MKDEARTPPLPARERQNGDPYPRPFPRKRRKGVRPEGRTRWCAPTLIGLLLLFCTAAYAVSGVTYKDVNGTTGLTIKAVLVAQCTGTPPSVTINGGATQHMFTDCGSGTYWRQLAEGHYHVFSGSTWIANMYTASDTTFTLISAINANGWVTNARLVNNCVTSAKVLDGTLTLADLGSNSVNSDKVVDGSLTWGDHSSAMVGDVYDDRYNIGKMQSEIRALYGNWNVNNGFDMGEVDSLLKRLVLDLHFEDPCEVQASASNASGTRQFVGGIRLVWNMNTAHNDSAVARYEIYLGVALPSVTTAGLLDPGTLATLRQQMGLFQVRDRPGLYGGSVTIAAEGQITIVVVAVDWQGNYWGSTGLVAMGYGGGIGDPSSLVGAPGYTAGMTMAEALRDALGQIDVLKNALSATTAAISTGVRVVVYSDHAAAGSAYNDTVNPFGFLYRVKTGGPPSRKVAGTYRRFFGYNRLHLTCETKMKTVGSSGWLYFDYQGTANSTGQLFGTGTAVDTVWTKTDILYYDLLSIAGQTMVGVDSIGTWGLGGTSTDTLFIRNVVVTLER